MMQKMQRTITFLDKDYELLQRHLFKDQNEQAAFLLCSLAETDLEMRLLVNQVIPVAAEHIEFNAPDRIRYTDESYYPVISEAKKHDQCFIMVHSHLNGFVGFSTIDDDEINLIRYAYNRISHKFHGSIVFNDSKTFVGRIFNNNTGRLESISKLRVLGDTYKIYKAADMPEVTINKIELFDRNIRAFGEDLQKVLQNIHVGVIGCGGNGSAVIEQLCRMGVSKLTIVDDDEFDNTNITRMHGSCLSDEGQSKVNIMKNMIDNIGLETEVIPLVERLNNQETAMKLRDCEIIFSCLDLTHYTRAILNQMCYFYYIPVIDMGIKFDSRKDELHGIYGRVDVITPNVNCLFCRDVINSKTIAAELMGAEEYMQRRNEGYAPELPKDKVQAMPYNTLIASYAIIEMIQLLTNFKGTNNYHTIYRFIDNKASNAGVTANKEDRECGCSSENFIGKGDCNPFLLMSW